MISMAKQITMIVIIIMVISVVMTGCITERDKYASKPCCIQFPIIVDMDGICFVLSADESIDLRRDDGKVFHGEWDLITNEGCTSFRIDFKDIDAYPATLTIYGNKKAELWLTCMGMSDSKIYGEWW